MRWTAPNSVCANVLTGSMAMVGPRPERPEFVRSLTEQIPYYSYRHCVKPGITGWAQINYKYSDSLEDVTMKLEYDLYYIKNLTVSLDMYIIFHTMKVMFFRLRTVTGQPARNLSQIGIRRLRLDAFAFEKLFFMTHQNAFSFEQADGFICCKPSRVYGLGPSFPGYDRDHSRGFRERN